MKVREMEARRETWRSGRQGVGEAERDRERRKEERLGGGRDQGKGDKGRGKKGKEEEGTVREWREAWGEGRQERGNGSGNCC